MTPRKLRLAVLVSGGGTNLQSLLDRSRDGRLAAEVVAVASDNPGAYGLERARAAGVPAFVVDYGRGGAAEEVSPDLLDALISRARAFLERRGAPEDLRARLARRVAAERALIAAIEPFSPDYVCCAGFMRLLSPYFLDRFRGEAGVPRVLNVHPALLPAFPGTHGNEDTLAHGVMWGGVTVHFMDEGEDSGPVIAQAVYPVYPADTVETVRARGLALEYEVYAQVVNWLARGEVEVRAAGEGGGRPRVCVTDPNLKYVLRGWLELAFSA